MKRRAFTRSMLASSLMASHPIFFSCNPTNKPLKVLILGGTKFVGPAIVNAAINADFEVTLFNRGVTNPTLFSKLPLIKGDRNIGPTAYAPLNREKWDIVIDVWPEKAQLVDEATAALKNNTRHYIYISSIAVYQDFQEVGLSEKSAVINLSSDQSEWYYGEEKLAGENHVRSRFPNQHTILRAGPIKGWRDDALDLLYWCLKLQTDTAILAPGSGIDPIQFIDAKDIGNIVASAAANNWIGTFNCTGPAEKLSWESFLAKLQAHFNSKTDLHWAPEDFLHMQKVYSFSDLPLWAPLSEDRGFMQISNQKLLAQGFKLRPIEDTIQDCWQWYKEQGQAPILFGTKEIGLGLDKERELTLINQLKAVLNNS